MGKVTKSSDGAGMFAHGGKTKMFAKGVATPAVAGVSGKQEQGGTDAKFAAGGKTKMFGKGTAGPASSGVSGKQSQ